MAIYYFIIVLISIFCIAEQYKEVRKYKQLIVLGFTLLLGLFAGLRGSDPDYQNYVQAYIEAGQGYKTISDIGFTILCSTLNLISNNAIIMFLVVAVISVGLNLNSFYKYSPYLCICILMYFVHNFALKEMIQIRAGLASALCLFSIRYLPARQYKRALIFWFLAMSIHISSFIYIILFIVDYFKPPKKNIIYAIIISICIGTVFPLGQVIKEFTNIGNYSERIEDYVLYGNSGYASTLGIWTNPNTIKSLLLCGITLLFYNKLSNKFIIFRHLFLAYTIGVCWLVSFNDFSIIAARISNIFMCGEPILISYLCSVLTKRTHIAYIFASIIIALIIFNLNIAPDRIAPYTFYF